MGEVQEQALPHEAIEMRAADRYAHLFGRAIAMICQISTNGVTLLDLNPAMKPEMMQNGTEVPVAIQDFCGIMEWGCLQFTFHSETTVQFFMYAFRKGQRLAAMRLVERPTNYKRSTASSCPFRTLHPMNLDVLDKGYGPAL